MDTRAAILLAAPFAALWVALALRVAWTRTPDSPRCGRTGAFLLRLILPTWVFIGVTSTFLTFWLVVMCGLRLPPWNIAWIRWGLSTLGVTNLFLGLALAPVVGRAAAAYTTRRLRVWLARDPADGD